MTMATKVQALALVSESKQVKLADLVPVTAALQTQFVRDFTPKWRRPATITPFTTLADVPLDAWPVIVRDDIPYNAQGIHLDKNGVPFSLVLWDAGWSLTTSHECLEMLADPFGKRVHKGPSRKPGQGVVEFLVEVCDPSESEQFAYDIGSVTVSDFYYSAFFDAKASTKTRYSFTGAITTPRSILEGGYLSWRDPATNHWWQQTWFGGTNPSFRDLGVFAKGANPRRMTDGPTEVPRHVMVGSAARGAVAAAPAANGGYSERAAALRAQIKQIVADAK
jgi:hypothetical protein